MGLTKRQIRVNFLLAVIQKASKKGLTILKDKLVAEVGLRFGVNRRYILEDLKDLELTDRIIIRNNQIFSKDAWESEKILREDTLKNGK